MRLFLNSMPLSDRMYLGHMCTGKYSLIKVATMVSADLSGVGKASGPYFGLHGWQTGQYCCPHH